MSKFFYTINYTGKNNYDRVKNKNNQTGTHNSKNNITTPTKKDKFFGVSAGLASFFGYIKLANILGYNQYKQNVIKDTRNFSKKEMNELSTATQKAFENSGLNEHGVNFAHIDGKNYIKKAKEFDEQTEIYLEKHSKLYKIQKKITLGLEKIIDKLNTQLEKHGEKGINKSHIETMKTKSKMFKIVAEGKNSFFSPIGNIIAVNNKKLAASAFHEMGHALNFHKGHFPIRLRNLGRLAVPVMLGIGLFKSNKQNSENKEKEGLVGKTTSFIKNNAGKLIFASFLPTIAEEALASYKGEKLAKKVLSPELFKKVHLMNAKALSTYVISSVLFGSIAALAINVRDKVAGDVKK